MVAEVTPKGLIPQLAAMVEELRRGQSSVGAIGVAISGLVNRQTDRVIAPRDLPSTITSDLHGELMRATGVRAKSKTTRTPRLMVSSRSVPVVARVICST